jgi:uncharacterized protein YkwD
MLRPRYPAIPAALIAVLVAFGALLSGPVPANALTNCDVSDLSVSSEELAFLSLINAYRAANGAGPLTISENLNRAASWHAVDMANNSFSHTDSTGRSSSTRMFQCNVASGGTGENIAAGTSWDAAQEVFDAWKNSPGHNTNMLRSTYKQIGIARHYDSDSRYKYYWVTDFSTVNDGTNLGGGGGSSGGGSAPPSAPAPAKSSILSPTPGSELPGEDVTFAWSAGSGAQEYFLYVGTSRGRNNLYAASLGMNRQTTVYNLPTDGRTLYVRLWTLLPGGWAYTDYTYRAAD